MGEEAPKEFPPLMFTYATKTLHFQGFCLSINAPFRQCGYQLSDSPKLPCTDEPVLIKMELFFTLF